MAPLLYLLKRFPRLSQTFVLNELLELERQGEDVRVLASAGSPEPCPVRSGPVLRTPVEYLAGGGDDELLARVPALGPRHIHSHFATWGARAAHLTGTRTGIPYSFTAHAGDIYGARVDDRALVERIAGARFVVTVTDFNRRHLERLLRKAGKAGRVVRLYNGVDLDALAPRGLERDGDLVVGVGRLVEKKGFADLVDAVAALAPSRPRMRCLIVGEGPERAAVEARIAGHGLGDRVRLLGALPQPEIMDLVERAAVFALPCVVAADGDVDALPTVILEAMAVGTPVVSTTISGIPEMVEHERSGLLVPPRSPAALADALERLLADPAEGERLASVARAVVAAKFDLRRNVGRLRAMFAESWAAA